MRDAYFLPNSDSVVVKQYKGRKNKSHWKQFHRDKSFKRFDFRSDSYCRSKVLGLIKHWRVNGNSINSIAQSMAMSTRTVKKVCDTVQKWELKQPYYDDMRKRHGGVKSCRSKFNTVNPKILKSARLLDEWIKAYFISCKNLQISLASILSGIEPP